MPCECIKIVMTGTESTRASDRIVVDQLQLVIYYKYKGLRKIQTKFRMMHAATLYSTVPLLSMPSHWGYVQIRHHSLIPNESGIVEACSGLPMDHCQQLQWGNEHDDKMMYTANAKIGSTWSPKFPKEATFFKPYFSYRGFPRAQNWGSIFCHFNALLSFF